MHRVRALHISPVQHSMEPSAPAVLAAPQDSNGRLWGFEAGCSCKYLGYCSDKASNVQPDTSGRSGLCDACVLHVHAARHAARSAISAAYPAEAHGHAVLLCCLQALGLGERHILQVPMSEPLLRSQRRRGWSWVEQLNLSWLIDDDEVVASS